MARWSVVLGIMSAGAALATPVTYSVTPYTWVSSNQYVQVFGPNNAGQIVAQDFPQDYAPTFEIGTPSSGVRDLPFGRRSYIKGLNNLGQVTGTLHTNEGNRAVIADADGIVTLFPASPEYQEGLALNDLGQVLLGGGIGTSSGFTPIPLPPAWQGGASTINNAGQVAGLAFANDGLQMQAIVGTVSGTELIPLPQGWSSSYAVTINDSREVAGNGKNGPNNQPAINQAFIWTASGTMAIPLLNHATLCYVDLEGKAINNSGVVVGNCDIGPWIWDTATGTQPLNSFLPSGWTVDTVYGINDPGQIFARASFSGSPDQYVLLTPQPTPTPEPGTFSMLAAGLVLALTARKWPASRIQIFTRTNPLL